MKRILRAPIYCLMQLLVFVPASSAGLATVTWISQSSTSSSSSQSQDHSFSKPTTQTFIGRILSQNAVRYIFRDEASGGWYHLDDQNKAGAFFGKDVVVTGTIDGLTGTIRIQNIREKTAADQIPVTAAEPEQEKEAAVVPPPVERPKPTTAPPQVPASAKVEAPIEAPKPRANAPVATETAAQPKPVPKPAAAIEENSYTLVSLPEEAVGASGSVAVISRRSVSLPATSKPAEAQSGNSLVVGKPLVRVAPAYPFEAKQQRVEGTVKLHAVVGRDGTMQSVDPVSGPPPLVEAAMGAIREWRFAPTKLDGRSISVQDDVTVFFRLPE
jgi:periplasmic protein TonB